ncbi:DUF4245 domain-containing protein [Micromonospora sp. BRA006-A]|uniref:DUF4245 domain-containing protein n=1 Tax=Micromonospora sp. BRA006-A TaxID=2962860 RepID=UPI00296E5BAF|nr:DUF4245 domain-containing protein [Micromonospora sp. BRA006-A]MDW3845955.1 DUF4245 domain-containing protein [Micromonospora sp. BRA006-A]
MEAAQPADRTPTDATPPDGQPALVEPATAPSAAPQPAAVAPAPAEPEPEPAPATGKARSERSPKDMALSLLILLVPIALLLAFYRGFLGGDSPVTVDPAPALEQARSANAFPVSEPTGLGDDWRIVNARFRTEPDGSTLRIGYVTPEGRGAQLVESNVPAEKLLPAELTEGQPQGAADLPGGLSWQRYTARGNEQALVLLEPNRTVIVVGDAGETELRKLATSLR